MADATNGPTDYTSIIPLLESNVRAEIAKHKLHGISLALVDDQRLVYSAGFGDVKRDSIFRAGSISKLFNALAVMQLVERGKISLDAPIDTYGREFTVVDPFEHAPPITIHQLLCHRSGIFRESPVGGYFDSKEPGLAATVASIRSCVLVNPPNTKTRYSNVGPSIAGQIVAKLSGMEFPQYQREHLLAPLGMSSSSFLLSGIARDRLAEAYMQVPDGQGGFAEQKAPVFDLGTIPAGNLFTCVEDLARFVSMLAADGKAGDKQIVSKETLAQMWTPQLIHEDSGFGIGFLVGKFRKHKSVSHNGAVYGFSSSLVYLPELKIGAIFLCNDDIVNGNVGRLSNLALDLMLKEKLGETMPTEPATIKLTSEELAAFTGEYESPATWAEFKVEKGHLAGKIAGHSVRLLPNEPTKFIIDGRAADRSFITFEHDAAGKVTGFTNTIGAKFVRVADSAGPVCPAWKCYVGSYGPSYIPLVISVRHGHLYAMTENVADYRLTPINRTVFAFPAGLYADEQLVFLTDLEGRVSGVNLTNMTLPRN